jgi:hypothetical protein
MGNAWWRTCTLVLETFGGLGLDRGWVSTGGSRDISSLIARALVLFRDNQSGIRVHNELPTNVSLPPSLPPCASLPSPLPVLSHTSSIPSQYRNTCGASVSASDKGPEWAGHLLLPIPFSDIDSVDYHVFPVGSKPSQLPDLILSSKAALETTA